MSGTSDIKSYLKEIITDILPSSPIEKIEQNNIGLYKLAPTNISEWRLDGKHQKSIYRHEKSAPKTMGITPDGEKYYSVYFKRYDTSMLQAISRIIVNSALEMYPTPMHSYGTIIDHPSSVLVGSTLIDLNHLKNPETENKVDSIRLDYLLHSLKLNTEIDSFYSYQKMLESGKLEKILTPRAIVQLGLSSIFIPNAIGETDANSRNVILLKDKSQNKYDIVCRIDADENEYIHSMYRFGDNKKIVPKGIYLPNEDEDSFLKTISHKNIGIDWELFSSFIYLTDNLCSRSKIDSAVYTAFRKNSISGYHVTNYRDFYQSHYNSEAFFDFSEATINRVKDFSNRIHNALSKATNIPPFAEANSKYNNITIDNTSTQKFIQEVFDASGKELK